MPNKKLVRGIFILFFSLVFLIVIAQLSFTFFWDNRMKEFLVKEVQESSGSNYQLEIGNLHVDIFSQSVSFSRVNIHPLDTIYAKASYYVSADEVKISDISVWQFLLTRSIISSKIEFTNPSAFIYRGSKKVMRNSTDSSSFSLYRFLAPVANSLEISSILIHNASFMVFDKPSELNPVLSSNENDLRMVGFKINRDTETANRWFNAKELSISLNNVDYSTKDSLYTFKIRNLNASYTDSTLYLDEFMMIPNFSKFQFGDMAGKQIDRIKVSVEKLQFDKIDIKDFFETGDFVSSSVKFQKPFVEAYRDKNDKRIPWHPQSIQHLIRAFPVFTIVDSLFIEEGRVVYEELAPGSDKAGRITFDDIDGNITGISNDTANFTALSMIKVNVSAKLLNAAKIQVHLVIPLNTDKMVFECSGNLQSFQLKELNLMSEETAGVSINSGVLDSMIFSFKADQIRATGKMIFAYHDLDFSIQNRKTGKTGILENAISWMARNFIVKKSNPLPGENLRLTVINYERNPSRFMFNYTFKALMSGIKPALGIKSRKKEPKD